MTVSCTVFEIKRDIGQWYEFAWYELTWVRVNGKCVASVALTDIFYRIIRKYCDFRIHFCTQTLYFIYYCMLGCV